jgi:NADH-quinone oxidoreductase subunit M
LALGAVPPYVELRNRRKPTRLYVLHMSLFVGLLVCGWALIVPATEQGIQTVLATILLLAAILIRCGSVPAHCWITDWFEHASFGSALLFVAPLTGVYAAVRLVVPIAPDWALQSIGFFSLLTAVYAAGMAVVQKDTRRLFAYLFLSHASLVLVGVELHTSISFTGSLALWISTALSLAGLGITMRALEARFGRLSLARFHGLYDHSPTLAICFLVMGLASAGFPGTFGFVAHELLIDGAVGANLILGLTVALAAAINGIAVVRAYFRLFTGTTHSSTVSLGMTFRERLAVLSLVSLILAGGLFPQAVIASRHRAAEKVLKERATVIDESASDDDDDDDLAH